jgi:DUF1009 family protein
MQNKNSDAMTKPLAIIAGRGNLPKMLIDACQKRGQVFKLFLMEGEDYEIDYSSFAPTLLKYGSVEFFLGCLKENNIKNLVFIGAINKPNFSAIKVDKKGAILLAKILANKILGDDAVLRTVMKFLEKEGLEFIAIENLLDCVISKKGTLSKAQPSEDNLADIDLGVKAIKSFSTFDVGQALIVAQKQIIAVEALEGTDEMIKRCEKLNFPYKEKAVLIKMKKYNQSKKADLPTIGVRTIENCAAAKIGGIAIQANSTLVLDKDEVIKKADELGLFLVVI